LAFIVAVRIAVQTCVRLPVNGKIGAWVLLAMGRLAKQLPAGDDPHDPRELLLVDEIGALGSSARHLRGLVGRAREAGLSLEIVGAMQVGALGNLLPLPKMDGQYVWGLALRTRPTWLAYAPAVLSPVLAVALICPHLPGPELQEILALFANPAILAGVLLLLLCGLPLIPRLHLPTETAPPTLNTADLAKVDTASE
jgi:hypothetical protein